MVRSHAGRHVRVERLASKSRSVAVHRAAGRSQDFSEHALITGENPGKVHHLAKSQDPIPGKHLRNFRKTHRRSRRFEVRGWNAGGDHDEQVEREEPARIENVADSQKSHDVGNLMRIRHHRARSPRNHVGGELGNVEHAAFDVNVCVDERRKDYQALKVHDLASMGIVAHAGHHATGHRHGSLHNLAGEDVGREAVR